MRKILITVFGLLTVLSIFLWLIGLFGFAVTSWLSSDKAEIIGQIMFLVACLGEICVYIFGWARQKIDKTDIHIVRKYGLK